ncbi:hypothetical protein PZA11_005528 [Diplocarpon coronariae]|uniref:Uncharacterized protein n=1 Tax=Diplocarpon coronariae TaxID=2795749 RepID=A0A218ZF80_9HELO|nr:hypothetical protein JHW43_002946 [Diplocarpon mali]OWP06677.1 hypothetical protein B2J93_5156 [Marssonina coronariae]
MFAPMSNTHIVTKVEPPRISKPESERRKSHDAPKVKCGSNASRLADHARDLSKASKKSSIESLDLRGDRESVSPATSTRENSDWATTLKKKSLKERLSESINNTRESLIPSNSSKAHRLDGTDYFPKTTDDNCSRTQSNPSITTTIEFLRLAADTPTPAPRMKRVEDVLRYIPDEVPANAPTPPLTFEESASQSFLACSIDLLIQQNPLIETDLTLLKKSLRDHETRFAATKAISDSTMHKKVWEAMMKVETLEKRVAGKDDLVAALYAKIDIHEHNIEKLNDSLKSARVRLFDLDILIQKKDRQADFDRRDYTSAVIRLEREKRALVEKTGIMEQELQTAKVKARTQQVAKEQAIKHTDGMRKSYGFYREYHDKQNNLYKTYFSGFDPEEDEENDENDKSPQDGEIADVEQREGTIGRLSSAESAHEKSTDFERDATLCNEDSR